MKFPLLAFVLFLAATLPTFAGEKLKLNPHLDFDSDSQDGPLITGDHMEAGTVAGKPSYVIMYGEACFNSKRQARRTVDLYAKYQGQVQFVIIDIDGYLSSAQSRPQEAIFSRPYSDVCRSRSRRDRGLQPLRRGRFCSDFGFALDRALR